MTAPVRAATLLCLASACGAVGASPVAPSDPVCSAGDPASPAHDASVAAVRALVDAHVLIAALPDTAIEAAWGEGAVPEWLRERLVLAAWLSGPEAADDGGASCGAASSSCTGPGPRLGVRLELELRSDGEVVARRYQDLAHFVAMTGEALPGPHRERHGVVSEDLVALCATAEGAVALVRAVSTAWLEGLLTAAGGHGLDWPTCPTASEGYEVWVPADPSEVALYAPRASALASTIGETSCIDDRDSPCVRFVGFDRPRGAHAELEVRIRYHGFAPSGSDCWVDEEPLVIDVDPRAPTESLAAVFGHEPVSLSVLRARAGGAGVSAADLAEPSPRLPGSPALRFDGVTGSRPIPGVPYRFPGAIVRAGTATITASAGLPLPAGTMCAYAQWHADRGRYRWNVTCGEHVLYGARNGGYQAHTPSAPGAIVVDERTEVFDGDSAFVWTASEMRLAGDPLGRLGDWSVTLRPSP